jgi:hypothetical protein|tara:strand:- start:593 stop:1117 length:525 start_codon:yes stop_codon:yes gene_type:complete
MNIFFLHKDPQWAANALCDKHVPKMLLESAQMLSTAVRRHKTEFENYDKIYKSAYPNHPMTKWVGDTRNNFRWALENAVFISQEYYKRFKKIHKSSEVINNIYDAKYMEDIPMMWVRPSYHLPKYTGITTPPQCMPDEYKDDDYVTAYRKYYQGAKAYFAKWQRGVPAPDWWAV